MMSSLDTNALLKSSALGIGMTIFLSLCGYAVNFAMGISPGTVPEAGSLPPIYSLFTLFSCCLGLLIYGVYGAAYGFFARRNETPVEVGSYALGGAASGLAAGLVSLGLSVINYLIAGPAMLSSFQQSGLDFTGGFAAIFIVSVLIGLCIAVGL